MTRKNPFHVFVASPSLILNQSCFDCTLDVLVNERHDSLGEGGEYNPGRMRNTQTAFRSTAACASAFAFVFAVGVLFAQDSLKEPEDSMTAVAKGLELENEPHPATVTVNGVEEPVYRMKDVDTKPRQIKAKEPKFSAQARRDKVQGIAVLLIVVTREGGTTDIRVRYGIGHGLDEEAVKAVRKWKFAPATKDGKPVAVQVSVEVDFHLVY
jgi:TonB family protein